MSGRIRFYRRRGFIIGAVLAAVPILALGWWLASPLFIDRVVDEPFPRAATAVVPDDMTMEQVEEIMTEAEAEDAMVDEPMPEMPEPEPETTEPAAAAATAPPPSPTTAEAEAEDGDAMADEPVPETTEPAAAAAVTTTAVAAAAPPSGPTLLAQGVFVDGDSYHTASGDVKVYRLEDGALVLRLEDIEVRNGPDLNVIVTPSPTVAGRGDVRVEGHLDLGDLKGNIGSQNYDLPAGYALPDEFSVVVFCVPFQVVFGSAEMRPA